MHSYLKLFVQIAVGAGALILVCAALSRWVDTSADFAGIAGIIFLLSIIALLFVAFLRRRQK